MAFVVSNAGVGVADKRIGAKESETRTEVMTNRTKPPGSLTFRSAWAEMMPPIWTMR